jgi:hypothetical protein
MSRKIKAAILVVPAILLLVLLFRGGGPAATPLAAAGDFFAFGWHYSREVWFRQSRNWPAAARARLLGFQHRPGHRHYSDLQGLSLFELARAYERADLPERAAETYLQARNQDPENLWLKKWVDDKLPELSQGKSSPD